MSRPSDVLHTLADDYDINVMTYGESVALDILVSDLTEALDTIGALAQAAAE